MCTLVLLVVLLIGLTTSLSSDYTAYLEVGRRRQSEKPIWDSLQIKYKLREAQIRSALREMRFWESLSPEDQLYFHMPIKGFNSEQQVERDRIPEARKPVGKDEAEDRSDSEEEDYEEDRTESEMEDDFDALYTPGEGVSRDYNPID